MSDRAFVTRHAFLSLNCPQLDSCRDNFLRVVSNDVCKLVWMFRQLLEVVSFRGYATSERRSNRARYVTYTTVSRYCATFSTADAKCRGILYFGDTLYSHAVKLAAPSSAINARLANVFMGKLARFDIYSLIRHRLVEFIYAESEVLS